MYCHDVSLYDCLSRSWFYPSNSQVLKDLKDPWDYPVIANATTLIHLFCIYGGSELFEFLEFQRKYQSDIVSALTLVKHVKTVPQWSQ